MDKKIRIAIKVLLMPVIFIFVWLGVYSILNLFNTALFLNEIETSFAVGSAFGSILLIWLSYWVIKKSITFIKKKSP